MTGLFTPPTDIAAVTKALSVDINNLSAAIEVMDNKLPTEAEIKRGTINFAVDTGAVNAYLVALPYVPSGYVDGLEINFLPLATNTTAATVNVNSLGVKSIRRMDGAALSAGDITVGVPLACRYSTTTGYFHINGNSAVDATAAAASAATATTQAGIATTQASAASVSAAAALVSELAAAASATVVASIFEYMTTAEIADVVARTGTLDVTAAVNAATATAKRIYFPPGTYILDGALLRSGMDIYGAGELTILKAKAGSTNAVLITENFTTLQTTYAQIGGAGPTYKSREGSSDFAIRDLAIFGNYVPTISSGGVVTAVTENASVSGIKIYGCNYKLENVVIAQCRYFGLYSEWSDAGSRGTGNAELESLVNNVKILYCGRSGVDWRGPHDSILSKVNVAWCNLNYFLNVTGGDYPGANFQKASNVGTANGNTAAGTSIVDMHVWGNSHGAGLDLLSATFVRDGYFEQASGAQIRIRAHGCSVSGDALIASNQAVTTGQVGVQIGNDADSATASRNSLVRADFRGLPTSVYLQASGGSNLIEINGYPENGSANAYTGTPYATDDITVNFEQSSCVVTSHATVRTKRETVAWATVNTATGAISDNEGMSYITRYSAGLIFVGFNRDVGTTRYSVAMSPGFTASGTPANGITAVHYNRTTTGFNVATYNAATGAAEDCTDLNVTVIGDSTKFI